MEEHMKKEKQMGEEYIMPELKVQTPACAVICTLEFDSNVVSG